MAIVEKGEWAKLHIAKFDDWTLGAISDQHVLGWLVIFPPRKIIGSLTQLTDDELIQFKKIAIIVEDLLKETFQAEWFNYSQAGNVTRDLHIHLQPRYSTERSFENYTFTDEGWGHPLKHLPVEKLPPKEIVFKIVKVLRDALKNKEIKDFKVEILNND